MFFSLLIGRKKLQLNRVKTNNKPERELFPHQMEECFDKKAEVGSARRRLGKGCREYTCGDGISVAVQNKMFTLKGKASCYFQEKDLLVPNNEILYQPHSRDCRTRQLIVSKAAFDRSISRVVRGPESKTITFPKTVTRM